MVNTNTIASRNASTTDVAALLQTASGCSTAGYVYSPSTNTCIGGGGSSGFPFTLGATTITATSSTTSLAGLTSLQGMYQASPYSAAQAGLGSGYIINNLCGGSACAISRDPADPLTDMIGKVEPNNLWASTYTPPAGSVVVSTNGGGFGVESYNGQGQRFLDIMSSGTGQAEGYNNQGYGAVEDIRYEDLNAGINGQGSIGVSSYSPQYRNETAIAFGEGTHTFDNINEISAGTSDSNFDERNYYCRPGNPQGSSEDCRFWQYSYWEAGAPTGNVTVGGSTTVGNVTEGATTVSFNAGSNQNMIAVGHQLIDTTAGVANSADTGVVNTSGTTVTWISGVNFANIQVGQIVVIGGSTYTVTAVASATSLTVGSGAGTQSNVAYTYTIPTSGLGTLALNTPVAASTGVGLLAGSVVVYPTSTNPLEVPSQAVDFVITPTSGSYSAGDLVNLNGSCCFIENVRLNSAVLGGAAWNSTTAYVSGNIRSILDIIYESSDSNTNSSPANSLTAAVTISQIQRGTSGVVTVTLASANNPVVGANVTISSVNDSSLNGTFPIASVLSTSQFTFNQAGPYSNQSEGTATGDWNVLNVQSGSYVVNANVRYPHYGGTACANGPVGYGMEVTAQTHTNSVTGQGDMRYVQYVTCSPSTTAIQVGGIQNGNIVNFGGTGVSSIILYPAADVQGILQKPSQAQPTAVGLSDNVGFPVGDGVEEAAQIYGKFNGQKEAYAFWNPNAQYDLHQVLLGGYSQTGTWWDVSSTGPSIGSLNPFNFQIPVSDFADLENFPAHLFNICSGGGCTGSTSLFSAGGQNVINFNSNGQQLTFGATSVFNEGFTYNAPDGQPHTATFTDPYSAFGPVASFANTSGYAVPTTTFVSSTGSISGFAPAIEIGDYGLPASYGPWAIGQGGAIGGLEGDFVLGYNPSVSGGTQSFTGAMECTPAGVCNFPNGLEVGGVPVSTSGGGTGADYTAPTIGTTALASGATVTNLDGVSLGNNTPSPSITANALALTSSSDSIAYMTGSGGHKYGFYSLANSSFTGGGFGVNDFTSGNPNLFITGGATPSVMTDGPGVIGWMPAQAFSLPDTGFSRVSAGVIAVGNGTKGDFSGTVKAAQYLGPATAPSGSCSTNGAWEFSQDGHATFCSAGTWVTKI